MYSACPSGLLSPWQSWFGRAPEEVAADLERMQILLSRWQAAQNLVSRETLGAFWTRHVTDSLQLLPLIKERSLNVFDLGSGGGFPALPLAICLKGKAHRFTLFESKQRKVAYLRAVIRELDLNAKVRAGRIEEADSRETGAADLITARALAPLGTLLKLAAPLLSPESETLFLKGRDYRDELDAAGADWQFDVIITASVTDPEGVVLRISRLSRKES